MSLLEASIRLLAEAVDAHDSHDSHDSHDHSSHDHSSHASHDSHDSHAVSSGKPWLQVVLASLLVNTASLSGVIIVFFTVSIPRAKRWRKRRQQPSSESMDDDGEETVPQISSVVDNVLLPCFASGALLATCVFLLVPEALIMLADTSGHDDHSDEAEFESDGHEGHNHFRFLQEDPHAGHDHSEHEDGSAWKFGTSLLAGFLLPIVLHVLFPPPHLPDEPCPDCSMLKESLAQAHGIIEDEKQMNNPTEVIQASQEGPLDPGDINNPIPHDCQNEEHKDGIADATNNTQTSLQRGSSGEETLDEQCDAHECNHSKHKTKAADETQPDINVEECGEQKATPSTAVDKELTKFVNVKESARINWGLATSILVGDFFHNFTDGVFIGNAFLLCTNSLAYTLAATTLYHEFAQELADFYLLTDHCGFKIWEALVLNFVSGLSVLVGALMIVSMDIPVPAMGSILAIGAGVYIYIACTECLPRVLSFKQGRTARKYLVAGLLCFALGAVPIGLVLLNHSHGC